MKKKWISAVSSVLACSIALAGLSACGGKGDGESDVAKEFIVPTVLKKTESGRVYIERGGKPYLYTGAAIRVDGYTHFGERSFDEMEEQFALASALGVNTVQVQIVWGDMEPQKDVFDFRQLRKMLDWAVEYDLCLDLLIGTPQECHWYLPSYIYEDEVTYPKYQSTHKGQYWWNGYHGTLVYDHPNMLARQRKFILAVGEFLYNWENNNGNPNKVISYGVNNEPDNFPRWTLSEYQISLPDGSRRLLENEAWRALYTALGSTAKAYKDSQYRALTRVNLVKLWDSEYAMDSYAKDIWEIPNIDMIGDDSYTESLVSQRKSMHDLMTGDFADNMPHVAENSGNFRNTASCFLDAIVQGAGYLIYCLALPEGYVDPNDSSYDYWEQGLYYPDCTEKPHTQGVKDIIHGINKAGTQLVVCDLDDMVGFNLLENYPQDTLTQEVQLGGRTLTYSTQNGGLGYAVYYNGYITVFATKDCQITFSGDTLVKAEQGYFNEFNFVSEGETPMTGNVLSLQGNTCYRILTNPAAAQ